MKKVNALLLWVLVLLLALPAAAQKEASQARPRRNVILFVADGLRYGSVNQRDTPALWAIRTRGVDFKNSYSLFPTFTTANASAIATGHHLGDTGDFSNTLWVGYPLFNTGNFGMKPGTPLPFLESDRILGDVCDHYQGNYLGEETFLQMAREHGYNTAAVGKLGPTGIQDVTALAPHNGRFTPGAAIIVDDHTGLAAGIPLAEKMREALRKAGVPDEAPQRSNGYAQDSQYNNGYSGSSTKPGTLMANVVQQQWFADVTTRGLLPMFAAEKDKPFAIVYWSRDPDGTQHNQGDSLGKLTPGINGETSRAGVRNADRNLQQILDWLAAHPAIRSNTDIFVTSDHGFATISRREIAPGHGTRSEAAQHDYAGANGQVDTGKGTLPSGFLAVDLALGLKTALFDPDRPAQGEASVFKQVKLGGDGPWEHPAYGNGLLGARIEKADGSDARAIVAANGGSDLIYVPDGSAETVRDIVKLLLGYDYVGGIFVDNKFGALPGTLPLSAIGLVGDSALPRPAIVIAFKNFDLRPGDAQTGVQLSDTSLREGQGMHGGFGRDSTYNNMAAMGPDFKQGFVDLAPVSNADIVPTLARLLHFDVKPKGSLQGRVAKEALRGQGDPAAVETKALASAPGDGRRTILEYQEFEGQRYLQTACFAAAAAERCNEAAR
jgi:arylsulfatase A-like enzyme